MKLSDFRDIRDEMCYRAAALAQIDCFEKLAEDLDLPLFAVGEHVSKSVRLPVVMLAAKGFLFYLRDNFHGLNLCVVALEPINIPSSVLFQDVLEPRSWDWYLGEIKRCRDYSWRHWSDEDMDDPRILRVFYGEGLSDVREPKEKDLWAKRLTDPSWFNHRWSSSAITLEGEFGPGVVLYVQGHPFAEGISAVVKACYLKPYKPGCEGFALDLGRYDHAKLIIQRLLGKQ